MHVGPRAVRVRAGEPAAHGTNLRGMDTETVRAMLLRNLGRAADDPVGSHDMYDDAAVLEFPQSGERFEGVANIREWRSRYPGSVTYDIRRLRGADDIWVAEMERHEALPNRAVMKGHRRPLVAVSGQKLRAA
jgi:hypothetical protein